MTHPDAFVKLLDRFLPSNIRYGTSPERAVRIRAQAMVAILGLSILLPLLALGAFLLLQGLTQTRYSSEIHILIGTIVFLSVQHLYFQSYGKLRITAYAYLIQITLSLCFSSYALGGFASAATHLYICLPLIAYITLGYREAQFFALLSFVILSAFAICQIRGVQFVLDLGVKQDVASQLVVYSLMFALFLLFLYFANLLAAQKE